MKKEWKVSLEFVLGIGAAFLLAVKPAAKGRVNLEAFRAFDYAHRGLHNLKEGIPENTLPAFWQAVERGFGIELDVHLTKDDQLVVFHDDSLVRACGVELKVSESTYEELYAYSLFQTKERMPLFSEVLDLVGGKVPLIIELKTDKNNHDQLCRRVMEELRGYQGLFCMESFDPRVVRWLKLNQPAVIRGQLTEYFRKHGTMIHPLTDFVGHNLITNFLTKPDFISYQHLDRRNPVLRLIRRLYQVQEVSWTVRNFKVAQSLREEGCIVIFEGFENEKV